LQHRARAAAVRTDSDRPANLGAHALHPVQRLRVDGDHLSPLVLIGPLLLQLFACLLVGVLVFAHGISVGADEAEPRQPRQIHPPMQNRQLLLHARQAKTRRGGRLAWVPERC
jgi:hypothetical protein